MAGPFIKIEVKGEKQLMAGFLRVGRDLSNFRVPLTAANALIRKSVDTNFEREGSELGKPWKKLSKPAGHKILQDTGLMRGSFLSMISNTRVEISNTAPYFAFHQSNRPRHKLPRRIMMRIDKQRRDEVMRLFTVFLDKVAKRF